MDVLNFDNAVSAYNNLEAFQSEKQQQLKDLVETYRQGAEQALLPAIELYQRGKGLYNKLSTTAENIAATGEDAVTSAVEGATDLGSETLSSLTEGAISGVTSRLGQFSSSIRGIGNQLSQRMQTNAFERDPEAELASGEDNMGILDRAQSLFRGGISEGENAISGAVSSVRGAVSGAVSEAASGAAEGVAAAVGETVGAIAAESIPLVGEIGMLSLGVYEFAKSFTEKAPVVQAFATPVFEKGV